MLCFYAKAKALLFGLPKVDAVRNLFTTQQHNPNVQICAALFMDDSFVNLGEYMAGCAQGPFHRMGAICFQNSSKKKFHFLPFLKTESSNTHI